MHATICRYATTTVTPDVVIGTGRALAHALSDVPGFVSFVMVDEGDGRLASICIVEAPDALEEADRIAAAWLARHVGAGVPQAISGEVVFQKGL